jgi:peptidoglycan/LPS O-acetylase OafA/YrhL
LADSGARGVQLFFVLSAFTLCMSWDRGNDTVASFYVRRLFRIAPMFWLASVSFICATGNMGTGRGDVIFTSLFLHGFRPTAINSVVPGGWSIADEMTFYALFPFIFFLSKKPILTGSLIIALGAVCLLFYGRLVLLFHNSFGYETAIAGDYFFLWFPNQFSAFLFGFIAFYVDKNGVGKALTNKIGVLACMVIIVALPFIPFLVNRIYIYEALFAYIVVCAVRGHAVFLVNKILSYIGERSFSGYLVHFFVLGVIFPIPFHGASLGRLSRSMGDGVAGYLCFFPMFAAITVGISALTYRLIELPTITMGSSVCKRFRRYHRPIPVEPPPRPPMRDDTAEEGMTTA